MSKFAVGYIDLKVVDHLGMWVLWFEREFWAVDVDSKEHMLMEDKFKKKACQGFETVEEYWGENLGKEWPQVSD